MTGHTISLAGIHSLSGKHFFIPDYQRGYRWSQEQVERMLDDFRGFCDRILRNQVKSGEFYCLQPVVVRKRSWEEGGQTIEGYEVIDGQQRLTTLYILLKYLDAVCAVLYPDFELYSISYGTRASNGTDGGSRHFLENIGTHSADVSEKTVDFHYMQGAWDCINAWIADHMKVRNKLVEALLDSGDLARNVRMIWYDVTEDRQTDPVAIFSRLNVGKIPLTNAELVKALLLRCDNFGTGTDAMLRQSHIATEWDAMEKALRNDAFWYFLYRSDHPFAYENRIEFVFDLMSEKGRDAEFYHTFNFFSDELKKKSEQREDGAAEAIWQDVKDVFLRLSEWYEDRNLYHRIGFLIEYGADIRKLVDESQTRSKSGFNEWIDGETKSLFRGVSLRDLSYENQMDRQSVKKVLLFFNILTVLQSDKSDMRFPFYRYKTDHWDIEHISSQTEPGMRFDSDKKSWLEDMQAFFPVTERAGGEAAGMDGGTEKNGNNLAGRINDLWNSDRIDTAAFDELFKDIQRYFGEDVLDDKDALGNLALLDAETNRSYGNAFFPVKRKTIIDNDEKGIFIPIATRNVFLKYYSRGSTDVTRWGKSDAVNYRDAVEKMLDKYIGEDGDERSTGQA